MNFLRQHSKRIYIGTTAVALILAAALCFDYGVSRQAEESEVVETVTSVAEKEKKDKVLISVSTETIEEGLANMGVLITQEYYFTQLEKYTKEKTILKFITTQSQFMYSYDGAVLAGVNFEDIKITRDDDRSAIIVEMPPSEVRAVTIDRDTFKIYSEKESLWNPLKLEDYNISLAEFEEAAKQRAVEGGILTRSDEQAQKLVREFIVSLPNTAGYAVEFK